jgi:D-arabinose 1-dehydrogenase-like Zn-dependent alcohol dehydrogenase
MCCITATIQTVDAQAGDVAAALQELGGAAIVLATAFNAEAMSKLIDGLKRNGVMVSTSTTHYLVVTTVFRHAAHVLRLLHSQHVYFYV